MYFVDKVYLAVALAELVLRVDEYQTLMGSYLLASGKELACVVLYLGIVLGTHKTLSNDLFLADVQVVTLVGLSRRGDDRLGEALVLAHTVGQTHSAYLANTFLIVAPCAAGEYAADNHLDPEALALQTYRHHGVGCGKLPVGADVGSGIKEACCNLVEHLSLEGYSLRQHHVESRYSVGCNHYEQVVVDVVNIAHLAVINAFLS